MSRRAYAIVMAGVGLAAAAAAIVAVSVSSRHEAPLRIAPVQAPSISPLAGSQERLEALLPEPPDVVSRERPVPARFDVFNMPPPPQATPRLSADRLKLGLLATNYVYRSYSKVGDVATGKLEDNRHPLGTVIVDVAEGQYLEEDMYVASLLPDRCVMALGDATYDLDMIGFDIEDLLRQLQERPRELTAAEEELARKRYQALWGAKFREFDLNHPSERQSARQPTEEEQVAARVKFWEQNKEQLREGYERYLEGLGEEAEMYPSLKYFDGPPPSEIWNELNEYLDMQQELYQVDVSAAYRRNMFESILQRNISANPEKWITPGPVAEP